MCSSNSCSLVIIVSIMDNNASLNPGQLKGLHNGVFLFVDELGCDKVFDAQREKWLAILQLNKVVNRQTPL